TFEVGRARIYRGDLGTYVGHVDPDSDIRVARQPESRFAGNHLAGTFRTCLKPIPEQSRDSGLCPAMVPVPPGHGSGPELAPNEIAFRPIVGECEELFPGQQSGGSRHDSVPSDSKVAHAGGNLLEIGVVLLQNTIDPPPRTSTRTMIQPGHR